jgi:hypothetical protein
MISLLLNTSKDKKPPSPRTEPQNASTNLQITNDEGKYPVLHLTVGLLKSMSFSLIVRNLDPRNKLHPHPQITLHYHHHNINKSSHTLFQVPHKKILSILLIFLQSQSLVLSIHH